MEALVENTTNSPARFYCHCCSVEFDRESSQQQDFTCPHCLEGFVEELPAADRSNNVPSSPPPQQAAVSELEPNPIDFFNPQAIRLASEIFSNGILSPLLLSTTSAAGGPRGSDSDSTLSAGDDGTMETGAVGGAGGGGGGGSGAVGPTTVRVMGRPRNRRRGMQNINNLDNILREILISVADGANGGAGGTPMFFMGNPGDYAWGREGLDAIVTQLLNQMDNTGPPPLEKEKIAEIPKVTIGAEHAEKKLQCSVCWEDFVIDEVVRQLSCSHLYHETCIIPWLELHGTCPICRKSLAPEQQPDEQRGLAAAANAVANTLRSFQSDAFPGATTHSSSSSMDEGGPSTSSLRDEMVFFTPLPGCVTPPHHPPASQSSRQHLAGGGSSNVFSPPSTVAGSASTATSSAAPTSASQPRDRTATGSMSNNASGSSGNRGGDGVSRYRDDDGNIDYDFD